MGAAPTGNRVEVSVMAFLRFGPDGKIVERWTRLDKVGLLTHSGSCPPRQLRPRKQVCRRSPLERGEFL